MEDLKDVVKRLQHRDIASREAFGFAPTLPFLIANEIGARAKIHFNDPDDNSLACIAPLRNPKKITKRYYLNKWKV